MSQINAIVPECPLYFGAEFYSTVFGTYSNRLKLLRPTNEYKIILEDSEFIGIYLGFGVFKVIKKVCELNGDTNTPEYIKAIPTEKEVFESLTEEYEDLVGIIRFEREEVLTETTNLELLEKLIKYHGDIKGELRAKKPIKSNLNLEVPERIKYNMYNYIIPYDKERILISLDDRFIIVKVDYKFK